MYIYIYIYMYIYIYIYIERERCICAHVYIYTCMYMYIHIHLNIYIYIYIHRGAEYGWKGTVEGFRALTIHNEQTLDLSENKEGQLFEMLVCAVLVGFAWSMTWVSWYSPIERMKCMYMSQLQLFSLAVWVWVPACWPLTLVSKCKCVVVWGTSLLRVSGHR